MEITTTTPLTFQGDASKTAKCTLATGDVVFRKSGAPETIAREVYQLQNLANSSRVLRTPQLVDFADDWLATSWIDGQNLAEQFAMTDSVTRRRDLCEQFGHVLGASIAIASRIPEPSDPFDAMFEQLECLMHTDGKRVVSDQDAYIQNRVLGDVWREISEDANAVIPEIRFMQGDWCLPNVLTNDAAASSVLGGIVDWSEAGWMDWRFCVADGLWSIGYNSRLAGIDARELQIAFLDACELDVTDPGLIWCRKIRALMALI